MPAPRLVPPKLKGLPGRLGPDVMVIPTRWPYEGGRRPARPTTARRRGQRHQLMLTRYHAGKADEVESKWPPTDRFGVVNCKIRGRRQGRAPGPHRYPDCTVIAGRGRP